MDLVDRLSELRNRIVRQRDSVGTEEAAKTAFVLPFIQALGYDIFDPSEVVPELTADHGVNNRRPICRLHFGKKRLAISVFLPAGEVRWDIDRPSDLYTLKAQIGAAIGQYIESVGDDGPTDGDGMTMFDVASSTQAGGV